MKKRNFFYWYYASGLEDLLEIEKDLIYFIWRFFSVKELLFSLFSPWKRDATSKYWRGFNPLKSLGLAVENAISRLIGAIVRSLVIAAGIICAASLFLFFLLLALVWLFPPLLLAFLAFSGAAFFEMLAAALAVFAAYIFFLYVSYKDTHRLLYFDMDLEKLAKFKWFSRVWNRLGMEAGEIRPEWLGSPEGFEELLKKAELNQEDFQKIIDWEIRFQEARERKSKFWLKENLDKISPLGRHWRYAYTAKLDRYATDLTHSDPTDYREDDFVGREDQVELLHLILERGEQNSAILVGASGTGRLSLVHSLARKIRLNKEVSRLAKKRILVFDLSRMIAESLDGGVNAEALLYDIFREAAYAGNVIIVIQNIEKYLEKQGSASQVGVAAILSEFLPLPSFQILATSTPKEFHRLIEKEDALLKFFETVEIKEPTEEESVKILLDKFSGLERQRVVFTYKALKQIVESSGRYHWGIPLPERALDLAEEVLLLWKEDPDAIWVTPEAVDRLVSMKTGAPQGEIRGNEKEKLLRLEEIMHQRVIGQEEAIRQVSDAMRRARTGINNPERPLGSFLFLGPTGVGKTETAKALAEGYFGDEKRMIRFDMSEFQSRGSIERMIGSPASNLGGILTNKIKDNPYSLLLLDELEKADPGVLDIFLQILDEGFVTDAFGEKVNFRNCIVIATSNAGAELIKKYVEQKADFEKIKNELVDYTVRENIFRLEFLNRFDSIIIFHPLNERELGSVAALMLYKIQKRAAKEKGINLIFGEDVASKVIQAGYNPIFGARSIARYIEEKIENAVAGKIISGEAKKGEEIYITAADL